jgi:hypothetical protein
VSGDVHVPHSISPPQPSPAGPQLNPSFSHVVGTHGPASDFTPGWAQNPSMQEMPDVEPQQSEL